MTVYLKFSSDSVFEFIIDLKCLKQQLGSVFALKETVYEEQIVISAELEPASEEKSLKPKNMMVLDVGCGSVPVGDVNCDLCPESYWGNRKTSLMHIKLIPNFVLCDAHYLPFKDWAFESVISKQVIEHVANPYLMLKEIARVGKSKLTIECPHKFSEKWYRLFGKKHCRN
jgi:SAM-dependent methyltransferase